jgi:hypothetical protein
MQLPRRPLSQLFQFLKMGGKRDTPFPLFLVPATTFAHDEHRASLLEVLMMLIIMRWQQYIA